ncbi:hypothetical protein OAA47_01770 [Methylophilaceae bacterium]|nr:hypothetical protein [Methylophilaceae bacterium]
MLGTLSDIVAIRKKNDVLLYADAEKEAQQFRRGLWKALSPTSPWEWRKKSVKN